MKYKLSFLLFFVLLLVPTASALTFFTNASNFPDGTFDQTFLNGSFVQLNATFNNGSFTSEVFDSGSNGNVSWDNISWSSSAVGNLANNNEEESKFVNDNVNMSGNIALYHLDQSAGTNAPDTSGNNNNATATNMEDGDWVAGQINNALEFGGTDEFLNLGDIANFERTDTFSYGFWFKTTTSAAQMIMTRQQNSGIFRGWNMFIESGKLKMALIGDNSVPNRIFIETDGTFNDGAFHHVVITYTGSSAASGVAFYVDGVVTPTTTLTDTLSITTLTPGVNAQISGRDGANVVFIGTVDEAFIYNKTLGSGTVGSIYRRGVRKLNLTARSCNDSDCVGETFTSYGDSSPINLTEPNNRFFQFRFNFSTSDVDISPELYNVSVEYIINDTTPPTINNVSAATTSNSATITWTTDEISNSSVNFGLTTSLGTQAGQNDAVVNHSVLLTPLASNTTYFYNVTSCDTSGNCSFNGTFNFTTNVSTVPIISNITESGLTPNQIVINWTTQINANSSVNFGTTTSLGTLVSDGTLVTAHSLTLSPLISNTIYFYNVTSVFGSNSTTNGTFNFTTPVIIISNIIEINGTLSTNVTWDTNGLSNSTLKFGLTTALGTNITNTSNVTSHFINVPSLLDNTLYFYTLTSCDLGSCATTTILNFTTNAIPSIGIISFVINTIADFEVQARARFGFNGNGIIGATCNLQALTLPGLIPVGESDRTLEQQSFKTWENGTFFGSFKLNDDFFEQGVTYGARVDCVCLPNECFFANGSIIDTVQVGFASDTFVANKLLVEDLSIISVIITLLVLICTFAFIGFISPGIAVKTFGYAMAVIQFVVLNLAIYLHQQGGSLTTLLRVNFLSMFVIGILAVILLLLRLMLNAIDPQKDSQEEDDILERRKWRK